MRAANRLFYSLFTELGIVNAINYGVKSGKVGDNLLGRYGIDVALFAKDLLLPLIIYRQQFGQNMPDIGTYVQTNALRTALKIFVARAALEKVLGSRNATDPVFVALRACENEGLFDRQVGFVQGHIFEGFDFAFDEMLTLTDMALTEAGMDVNFGDSSKNAKEIMRHSRDLLYNMNGYPGHFQDNLRGTANIMAHNQALSKLGTPGLFGFDSTMEVKKDLPSVTIDTSASEEIVRTTQLVRDKLAREVYRQRDLLNSDYGSLLRGVLKEGV